jgi:two-component system response regulator (stage 0 sporulation protein F)
MTYGGGMKDRKTILFVDDDESIRLLAQEALSKVGYEVIVAEDGREAMNKVEQRDPDMLILDIQMSPVDGIEVLPKILRKKRNIPVILYTAYPQYQEDFMAWAADAYVVKSSDLSELKEKKRSSFPRDTPVERLNSLRSSDQRISQVLSRYEPRSPLRAWFW